jgi:hypothetical protein
MAWRRGGARHERSYYDKYFPTLTECRQFARADVEQRAAKTREQSRETRERRQEQNIAKIARDYLLGKHIGNSDKCRICNRDLTDPVSIARAIGSECWPRLEDRLASEIPRSVAAIAAYQASIAELENRTSPTGRSTGGRTSPERSQARTSKATTGGLITPSGPGGIMISPGSSCETRGKSWQTPSSCWRPPRGGRGERSSVRLLLILLRSTYPK